MHVIPRDERLKLDANCDLLLSDALAVLEGFNGTVDTRHWRALARSEQLTFYRAVMPSYAATVADLEPQSNTSSHTGSGGRLQFLVTGYLNGSLAQVMTGLSSDTSRELMVQQSVFLAGEGNTNNSSSDAPPSSSSSVDLRTGIRSTFSGNAISSSEVPSQQKASSLIDASVLHAEQDHRRAPFRFAGVKWYAWHAKDGGDQRDLLAYERRGATNDNNDDQELMYHVVQSIERSPEMRQLPPGMRHTKLSICYLYREVCDDLVECFAVGQYPARGSAVSQRAEDAAVSERVLTVSKALAAYTAKKLSRLIEKNRKLPVIMSKSCLRCSARRTVFDPLRTCSICKKSVCQQCRQEKLIFKLHIDTNRPETEIFCNKCLSRSKLPDTKPVSGERMTQLRKDSRARSLSQSSNNRQSIFSGGSGASGGSGGERGSIVSSVSSASYASTSQPMQTQSSRSAQQPVRKPSSTIGAFNYDALIHHYEVEKPMLVRPRIRTRASTLPSPLENESHDYNNNKVNNVNTVVKAKPEQPLTAIAVDVLPDEEVAANLRGTQIGLPVILMNVKPLRDTQLGVPVEVEPGRLSEPILRTTSCATFFGAVASRKGTSRPSITTLSPQGSPARRSDLYLADGPGAAGGGEHVEKLYQTYLERRAKLQTEASDEQELRNTRLAVSQEHQQQQEQHQRHRREGCESSSAVNISLSPPSYHMLGTRQSELPTGADLDGSRRLRHQRQQEADPPKRQNFHLDLYAQF